MYIFLWCYLVEIDCKLEVTKHTFLTAASAGVTVNLRFLYSPTASGLVHTKGWIVVSYYIVAIVL